MKQDPAELPNDSWPPIAGWALALLCILLYGLAGTVDYIEERTDQCAKAQLDYSGQSDDCIIPQSQGTSK